MDSLPPDVLDAIAARLASNRDLVALARCSGALYHAAKSELERRGIGVPLGKCREVLPAWRGVHRLAVYGLTPWAMTRCPLPALWLPVMPALRRLDLMNPRYPVGDFWPAVFAGCPRLRVVKVALSFNSKETYPQDVHHATQLVQHGAAVLHELEVRCGGLVSSAPTPCAAPAASDTLQKYMIIFPRVSVQVHAPLSCLSVEGGAPGQHASPGCLAGVEDLRWTTPARHFDPLALSSFALLRRASMSFCGLRAPEDLERCLAGLKRLPPSVESLTLHCGTWGMRGDVCHVTWGRPLAHLHRLRDLRVHLVFPPATLAALLGDWMGAGGTALRSVEAAFDESATDGIDDDGGQFDDEYAYEEARAEADAVVDGSALVAWLDARPNAIATVVNARRLVGAEHARARLLNS